MEIPARPNIKPFPPPPSRWERALRPRPSLKVGDNITTDHIMPAGAKILPYRSNIPLSLQLLLRVRQRSSPERCRAEGKGIVIGGANYGPGFLFESTPLVPLYLGVKAVIAKSFARIHYANLVNAGILR